MTSIALPVFIFLVWILWIPAALLERVAKQENDRGFSFVPVIPLFPLGAWGLAALLNWIMTDLGLIVVGSLHVLLLLALLVSAARSLWIIQQNNRKHL